jgi:hypothetical protein
MTPEEAREVVRRMLARMSRRNLEWWAEEILRTNRYQRWMRFRIWFAKFALPVIAIALIIIAILLWIKACGELRTKVSTPVPSGLACTSDGRDKIYHYIQISEQGCRTSMNAAFRQAENICAGVAASCTGATCAPGRCAPGVVVKDLEHISGWFSCDTYLGFTCDCGCR